MKSRLMSSAALALAAATLVAACGGGSKGAGSTATDGPTSTTAPTPGASTAAPSSSTSTAAPTSPASTGTAAWTTYGGSSSRSAAADVDAPLGRPAEEWRAPVKGAVYAQPLLVGDRAIVATETNTVSSFDLATGAARWTTPALGPPVDGSTLPCGNIDPSGITGTPVADTAAGVLYVVAFIADGPHHELFALDLATGAVRWHRQIDPPGLQPRVEQQRGALALANGRVYVPYGGLAGDCGPYKGAVVSSDTAGTGPLAAFVVPTTREGGIWSPPGPAVTAGGDLLVATGNTEGSGAFDDGNAVVRLTPDLKQTDVFAPANWATLNRGDVDLGSISPVVLASGRVFVAGKSGLGYLLDAQHLGGLGHPLFEGEVCRLAIGGAAAAGDTVVVSCIDEVVGVRLSGDRFTVAWHQSVSTPGPPIVSHGAAWFGDSSGTLHAVALRDGSEVFRADVGRMSRFASAAAAGSRLVVATSGRVISFHLG